MHTTHRYVGMYKKLFKFNHYVLEQLFSISGAFLTLKTKYLRKQKQQTTQRLSLR